MAADNLVSMGTEQQIAASTAVAVRAARLMGQADSRAAALEDDLRITNQAKSQVLRFEFTARTPKRAARGANAFAEAYLADRKARNEAAAQRATRSVEQQIKTAEAARKKETEKDTEDDAKAAQGELDTLHKRIVDIRSRDTDGGDIVRRGEAPAAPRSPAGRPCSHSAWRAGWPSASCWPGCAPPSTPGSARPTRPGPRCAPRCSACCPRRRRGRGPAGRRPPRR